MVRRCFTYLLVHPIFGFPNIAASKLIDSISVPPKTSVFHIITILDVYPEKYTVICHFYPWITSLCRFSNLSAAFFSLSVAVFTVFVEAEKFSIPVAISLIVATI